MKKILALLSFVLCTSSAFAATGTLSGVTVSKMIVAESRFGGCMIMLSKPISTALPSCPDQWLTLACDGSLDNSVARAMQKWDTAQLAYALGKEVLVSANDQKTANGYCFADIVRLEP